MEDFLTRVTQYHLIYVPLLVLLEFTINSYASLKRSLDPQIRMNFLSFSKPGLISRPILEIIWRFFLSKKLPQKIYHNIFFLSKKYTQKIHGGKTFGSKMTPPFWKCQKFVWVENDPQHHPPVWKIPKKNPPNLRFQASPSYKYWYWGNPLKNQVLRPQPRTTR